VAQGAVEYAIEHTAFIKDPGCTGVRITPGLLVTAKHCIEERHEGDPFAGGVLYHVDPKSDFVIVVRPFYAMAAPIRMRAPRRGEHVYVVGFPVQLSSGEQELTVTDGIVTGGTNEDHEARITAPVYFGNSGGGVWADDGCLVGIAVNIYAAHIDGSRFPLPYVGQAYMVPADKVLEVL
jgi:S1-C subfamily serine protease